MANSISWKKIFNDYNVLNHDFKKSTFPITADQIKKSCQDFKKTTEKEVRILCKQDTRESRPQIFKDNNLFLLPTKNKFFCIIKGEGYVNIPEITTQPKIYEGKVSFNLETSKIGDSEMQHLDFAYAQSVIRTFMEDDSLVLTIRGRKYTPKFNFYVGTQLIKTSGVQTEVDGGYEGKNKIVLMEAKKSNTKNTIIRQLYYPFRQWQSIIKKPVYTLFFEHDDKTNIISIWMFSFKKVDDYNSIELVKSSKFKIK